MFDIVKNKNNKNNENNKNIKKKKKVRFNLIPEIHIVEKLNKEDIIGINGINNWMLFADERQLRKQILYYKTKIIWI